MLSKYSAELHGEHYSWYGLSHDFMKHFPESTVMELLKRGDISMGKAAELLGISLEELRGRKWSYYDSYWEDYQDDC